MIQIATWVDVTTVESREEGEYSLMGQDTRTNSYRDEEFEEAIADFLHLYGRGSWDEQPEVNQIMYSSDPEIDYSTGEEYHDRLFIGCDDAALRDRLQILLEERFREIG
jgi:hypothetical protein